MLPTGERWSRKMRCTSEVWATEQHVTSCKWAQPWTSTAVKCNVYINAAVILIKNHQYLIVKTDRESVLLHIDEWMLLIHTFTQLRFWMQDFWLSYWCTFTVFMVCKSSGTCLCCTKVFAVYVTLYLYCTTLQRHILFTHHQVVPELWCWVVTYCLQVKVKGKLG